MTSASTKKWTALCPLSTQEMPCTASRPSGSGALKFEALGRRPRTEMHRGTETAKFAIAITCQHMSHVTCHMSHVNTLDASQQLQRKTPNLQGNNMEQHEQLNLTKLLPKLLTTVKGPFRVLPIEPAGTAQMLLGGRINLGLKLRVRT